MKKRLTVVLSIVLALVLVIIGYAIGAKTGITVNVKYEGVNITKEAVKDVQPAPQTSPSTTATQPAPSPDSTAPVSESSSADASAEKPAQDTPSGIPSTPAEIVAKYNEVINKVKTSTSTVAIHKVENIDVHVDDCSVGAATSAVNKIVEGFLKSTDNTLNFENGVATKEDGSQQELGKFIPPNGRNAELDAAGVKEASCVNNGDGTYVLNITLNQETSTFDGTNSTEPTAHKQAMDPLNLATLEISPAKITSADMTYPGLVIKATISDSGELKELYHMCALSGTGSGKVAVFSLDVTISGAITDTWTFTW